MSAAEQNQLKIVEAKLLRKQIARYDPAPVDTDVQWPMFSALKNDLDAVEKSILEFTINNPADVKPVIANGSESSWREASLMASYISNLKFSGRSDDDCENLYTKVKAIGRACPSISFKEIWNACQPCLPAGIIRTLAGKSIDSFDQLKEAISSTYGSHSNIFQKLEEFFNKKKNYKTPFPQHQSELEGSLVAIANIHKEWLRRRASLSRSADAEAKVFVPTYDHCLELINFLKLLTEIRNQDESLFRAVSIELSSINSPQQLATRAEQIRQQVHSNTGFNAAHRGSSRPGSNDRRKKKNANAEQGDKADNKPATYKKRGDYEKKSNGGRNDHVGNKKPSKDQQKKYGAHYSSCDLEIPSDNEDGAYQLRDDNYEEDEIFSDASGDESAFNVQSKN